jgi:hypothetical protein
MENNNKKGKEQPDKMLIFLKSSTVALGIIFVVLLLLLIVFSVKKGIKSDKKVQDCLKNQEFIISEPITKIIDSKKDLIILTENNQKFQELLILDKRCSSVKNRIRFLINN